MQKMSRILKKKAISLRHWSMYTKINRRKTFTSYHWQQYNTCYAVKQLPTQKSKGQFKHVRLGSGRFNIQQLPF
jgi:hypothetical protein